MWTGIHFYVPFNGYKEELMEDKWNPNESELESEELLEDLEDNADAPEAEEEIQEYTDEEPEYYEGDLMSEEPETEPEPPKPKPKKKSFKKKLRKAIRRFFKLPLLTRCIMAGLVVAIIAVIIVLAIVIPKNCKANAEKATPVAATEAPTDEPEATPEQIPTKTASTPTNPPASPIPRLSDTIKPNTSNEIIPFIRTRLVELGYMEMPETNDVLYDQATVNAIKRFQYRNFPDNFKDWDGYIGTKTYEKMLATDAVAFYMKSGDTDKKLYDGELVTQLQMQLVATGYLKSATGNYDTATVDAVRRFQKDNSLKSDGVAGQSTLKLLATKVAEAAQPTAEPETTQQNP